MDEKDFLILNSLSEDARTSIKDIAKRVKLPRSTVYDRIKKMKESGIIKKFTIVPDFKKLGKPITAFVLMKAEKSKGMSLEALEKSISDLPDVCELHLLTGDWDFLVKIRASSIESLGSEVVHKVWKLGGSGITSTHICFFTVKEDTFDVGHQFFLLDKKIKTSP